MFGKFTYSAILLGNYEADNFWFALKYFIVISILIYFLWIFSKFITKKNYISLKDRKVKVLERIPLSNDKFLLLVELENIFYFIGIDKNGMYLMDKRDDLDVEQFIKGEQVLNSKFSEYLEKFLIKKDKKNDSQ
ncbi:flagellar biosynthetic protein FliO [Fusibacter ferrireducens]|uniref:Flagellar biosynthetic protein FliO n=1 Tax=Fusibacter ferrireducens TaxID=2785058 RepID=A0ABR9ZMS2_9FIRM|nr:flagellar biosynthetic protein FliO [Fusibacter ferrireducens]MBF4691739.1 flagellar biosynthetic protein FliO [Fusibacter ferrireducens]